MPSGPVFSIAFQLPGHLLSSNPLRFLHLKPKGKSLHGARSSALNSPRRELWGPEHTGGKRDLHLERSVRNGE